MRLIDADRLSEAIYDNVPAPYEEAVWAKEDCLAEIEAAQTVDAVEVVRCRNCKYGEWDSKPDDAMVCMRTKDGFWRSGNDFCSYGERKGGDGNG